MDATDTIREIIETLVQTQVELRRPGTPVHFLNTRHETPSTSWIHVAVIPNTMHKTTIGPNREACAEGVVNVTCMQPQMTGTKTVRQLADIIATVLIDRQVSIPAGGHITTYGLVQRDRGVVGGFYTVNVLVYYRARVDIGE